MIDADGKQAGIMNVRDAVRLAESRGLDLVEVAATALAVVSCLLTDPGVVCAFLSSTRTPFKNPASPVVFSREAVPPG